jgi:hypothetical protein
MSLVLEIAFPLTLVFYYVVAYFKVRQKPEYRPVVVQFEPAEGLSPAVARYVWKSCVDQRTVACVFAQLAIKGLIHIEPAKGAYHITRTTLASTTPAVTREEQIALDWLFSNFLKENDFKPAHDSEGCIAALTGSLQKQAGGLYHATHYGYIALGILFALAAAFITASAIQTSDRGGVYILTWAAFMATLLAMGTVWVTLIIPIADLLKGIGSFGRLLFGVPVSGFALIALGATLIKLEDVASAEFALSVLAMAGINAISVSFLKSTTPRGMEVKQQLEGFREFLIAVEQDRLDRLHVPDVALRSSEQNLAYAISLEVKEAWGDALANACYPQLVNS